MTADGSEQRIQLSTDSWNENQYILMLSTPTEKINRKIQVNPGQGVGMIQERGIQYVVNVGTRNTHGIGIRTTIKTQTEFTDLRVLDPDALGSHSLDRIMSSLDVSDESGTPLHWKRVSGSVIRVKNLSAEIINVSYFVSDSDGNTEDERRGFYPATDLLSLTFVAPGQLILKVEASENCVLHWQSHPEKMMHQLQLGDWQAHRDELLILETPLVPKD